jgi:hypothetical protein
MPNKRLYIKRVGEGPEGVFGVMIADAVRGYPFAVTLELPDLDNQPMKSCIPTGSYLCKKFSSAKHPNTFEITGVPFRSAILFHTANVTSELLGCVAVGEEFGYLAGKRAIIGSSRGFQEFMALYGKEESFVLSVVKA